MRGWRNILLPFQSAMRVSLAAPTGDNRRRIEAAPSAPSALHTHNSRLCRRRTGITSQFECGWRMSLYRLERMRPLHGGTPKYTRPDRPF
jgi:hypothetical protein